MLMKTCDEIHALLPLYLTGDLPLSESESVRAHLIDCSRCRADRVDLDEVRTRLDTVPTPVA